MSIRRREIAIMEVIPKLLFFGILAFLVLAIVAITVAAWGEYRREKKDKHPDKD
jgi:hypothetical protein